MNDKNNTFTLKHGSVANKIRLLPHPTDQNYRQVYNLNLSGGGSLGIHLPYYKYLQRTMSTDEDILEQMDIKVIEQFLRKKKLLKIDSNV